MAPPPKAAVEPVKECPITGRPLQVAKLSNGKWQLRADGWFCTKLFDEESEAWHWVSHRKGVPPAFPARMKIVVTEHVAPEPDPIADIMPDSLKKAQ